MAMAALNLYKLMYPLAMIDLAAVPPDNFIKPMWKKGENMHLRVYVSTREGFNGHFIRSEFESYQGKNVDRADVVLLWDQPIDSPAFSKSFLLTSLDCSEGEDRDTTECNNDPSYQAASAWLDHAEHSAMERGEGGVLSVVSAAGHGVESTSILLTFSQSMYTRIRSLFAALSLVPKDNGTKDDVAASLLERTTIQVSPASPIAQALRSNSTLYAHVLLLRANSLQDREWPPASRESAESVIQYAYKTSSLLLGSVNLVKYDTPHHIKRPGRILYKDIAYLFRRFLMGSAERAPWDMAYSKPKEYSEYEEMRRMKKRGEGYPYWKPEVAIKYVNDEEAYPVHLAGLSGLSLVQTTKSMEHPTGMSFIPAIHVDEIGLTSEKYIPINATVTTLPLRISFDRSDLEHKSSGSTATAGGISPARWRLLSHLSEAIESQKQLGFEQSDIDDVRRLVADTNVTLLAITMLASALHLLFEFLTFKNEVSFWQNNKDLTGLSVRSLFLDTIGQTIILLYLIEQDSSLLITVPSAIGCLIALWKCQRGAGLTLVPVTEDSKKRPASVWNYLPRLFGYELRAIRLEVKTPHDDESKMTKKDRLTALTIESDRIATRTVGALLMPLVVGYTVYSFAWQEHSGWYSWLVTSASSLVYALGFALMFPQLVLNYKLKSVAHLPWRVLVYKSLNTFIDDLFSFIIKMPMMARVSCFRDDVVFFVYLYQRWLYPVDESRPVEGGGDGLHVSSSVGEEADLQAEKESEAKKKKKKKKKTQ